MYRVLLVALLFPNLAAAEAPALDLSWQAPVAPVRAPRLAQGTERLYDMEIGFRGRMLSVPDSIMDIWFFNETDEGWADSDPRPNITAYGLGLEFVVKGETGANGIFYFDYLSSTMKAGYWDDVEQPPNHLDGDYLVPSDNLGMIAFGADYAHELFFVRTEDTGGKFGLSFLVGAGLGMGVIVGEIDEWNPEGGVPAHIRHHSGAQPNGVKRIPKVLPIVDINAGLRFNFGDRLVLRFEGGLHNMLYYGTSLGIMF